MAKYQFLVPVVTFAGLNPAQADINTSVLLTVAVSEQTVEREEERYISGEFYAGEV